MQSIKFLKALCLSVVTLTAGYAMAESESSRGAATTPSDQSTTAATGDCCSSHENHSHEGMMMGHGMMNEGGMMARCKKMHDQMHQNMMQQDQGSKPSGDQRNNSGQAS